MGKYVLDTSREGNDGDVSSPNPVSMIFTFTVTDPSGFMSAFDAFTEPTLPCRTSKVRFIWDSHYENSGMMPGTHFVTWVADSRGKLVEAMGAVRNSAETQPAYMAAASGKRTLEATNMSMEVKRWVNGG